MLGKYLDFSNRGQFNLSLKHFRLVSSIVKRIDTGEDLPSLLNEFNAEHSLSGEQILSIVNVLFIDKYKYDNFSINIKVTLPSPPTIFENLSAWNLFDILMVFHQPQIGVLVLSNNNRNNWDLIDTFKYSDYLACYVKAKSETDESKETEVVSALKGVFNGKRINRPDFKRIAPKPEKQPPVVDIPKDSNPLARDDAAPSLSSKTRTKDFESEAEKAKNAKLKEAQTINADLKSGKLKMTPKYSCQVTNELFHNGNVEAWKNIIESFHKSHPGIKVVVFHDGEKINNINTLFKWGKVKHGDVILFSLLGSSFKNVSKLQRYLHEGASNRFNKYLKKDLNKPLELF